MSQIQPKGGSNVPQLGEFVKILILIGSILVSAGLAYGSMSAKTVELENRLRSFEELSKERDERIRQDIGEIKGHLSAIEVYLRNGSNRQVNQEGGWK